MLGVGRSGGKVDLIEIFGVGSSGGKVDLIEIFRVGSSGGKFDGGRWMFTCFFK